MKNLFYVVGIVLLLVGILGFVMQSPLFGWFETNAVQSVIWLVSGALVLWSAMKGMDGMVLWGRILGVVYALLAFLGFVMGGDLFGVMTVNMPDNILHLVVAVLLLYFGFMGKKASAPAMPQQMSS